MLRERSAHRYSTDFARIAERQNYRPSAAAWPAGPYLRRMSFLTFVTPPTPRVTSTALYILAWVLTKPLN